MARICILFLISLLSINQATADKPLIVTSALSAQPDAWARNGEIVGASVELMKLIFADLNISIETRVQPWARSLKELERGSIDAILTIFYTHERAKFIEYTNPYAAKVIRA